MASLQTGWVILQLSLFYSRPENRAINLPEAATTALCVWETTTRAPRCAEALLEFSPFKIPSIFVSFAITISTKAKPVAHQTT